MCKPWIKIRLLKLLLPTAFHHLPQQTLLPLRQRTPGTAPTQGTVPHLPAGLGTAMVGARPRGGSGPVRSRMEGCTPRQLPPSDFNLLPHVRSVGTSPATCEVPWGRRGVRWPSTGSDPPAGFLSCWGFFPTGPAKSHFRVFFFALAEKGFGCISRSAGSKSLTVQHSAVTRETGFFFQVCF